MKNLFLLLCCCTALPLSAMPVARDSVAPKPTKAWLRQAHSSTPLQGNLSQMRDSSIVFRVWAKRNRPAAYAAEVPISQVRRLTFYREKSRTLPVVLGILAGAAMGGFIADKNPLDKKIRDRLGLKKLAHAPRIVVLGGLAGGFIGTLADSKDHFRIKGQQAVFEKKRKKLARYQWP